MKNTFLLIAFLTLSTISYSQTIQLDSAAFYEGKTITICSKVQDTYETKGAKKTTYINFGKPYPKSTFTIVIFGSNLKNFKYKPVDYLKNKEVCVTGKITIYKGKPQMIITKEEQIQIKEAELLQN
jgi:DNA/RNA endonuclease YhcR with UshA esterase domain